MAAFARLAGVQSWRNSCAAATQSSMNFRQTNRWVESTKSLTVTTGSLPLTSSGRKSAFRTTDSVQCRPKRMPNLTAWQPLLQTLNFVWGMAWQQTCRHGSRHRNQFCWPVQHRQVQATAEEEQVRSHSNCICLTFNEYQTSNVFKWFKYNQMYSMYPRDSMFASAHCEASSKATASNLKAWIWGTHVYPSWHVPGQSCTTGCKRLRKILGFTLPTLPLYPPCAKKCNPDDTEPQNWKERWSNLGSSLLAGSLYRPSRPFPALEISQHVEEFVS